MSFQAVLFDLDGTLLDTIGDLTDAMNSALRACGFEARTVAECKHFVGGGVKNFALRALPPDHRDAATLDKILSLYWVAYSKNWDCKTRPYDGIGELLDALAARGLALVVYSNKPDEFTQLTVRKLLARWPFAAVVGAREGVPDKPDPSSAVEIAGRLRIAPAGFIYVGDTNIDMRTAVAAGMYPVGALWGFRTADELLAGGAKTLIERPTDLLRLLE